MTTLNDIAQSLMLELPAVIRATVVDALRDIAGDFCRETWAWSETERTALVPNVESYMVGDSSAVLLAVTKVSRLNGEPYTTRDIPIVGGEAQITAPSVMTPVTITSILAPAFGAELSSCPEPLIPYIDALIAGAKWKLKSMPGQQWYDPAGADVSYRAYRSRIVDAKRDCRNTRPPQSVKSRAFI